jgi:hypothetical protein
MMRRRATAWLLSMVLWSAVQAAEPLTDSQQDVQRAGDILRFGIPAAALLATFFVEPAKHHADDGPRSLQDELLHMGGTPRHDLLLAIGRAYIVTGVLKVTADQTRPDGGKHSFPSGHASMAFAGAEAIRRQHGWGWGAPALLAAGFVGWSRVETNRHHTHDVLFGAAIGILANHDFWRHEGPGHDLRVMAGPVWSGRDLAPGLRFELRR